MKVSRYEIVIAVFPNTRGIAYAIFEAPLAPVDWGLFEVRGMERQARCVKRLASLFERYEPSLLILQDMSVADAVRAARIRTLNQTLATFADTTDTPVVTYSRATVRAGFGGEGATKQRIAEAIAKAIPMFERLVPAPRKPWQSEHPRMGLFDAAALALTFYRNDLRLETGQR